MDLDIIDDRVADRIGNLRALDRLDACKHILAVLLFAQIRCEVDDRGDTLRNCGGGDHNDLFVLGELRRLLGSHNDILVIGQDIDGVRIYFFDCGQDIIRTGIHGLSAGDDIVHAESAEDFLDTRSDRYCDKSDILMGHFLHRFLSGCLHGFGSRLGGTGLLELHIFNDKTLELTVLDTLLDRQAGIIGMYLYCDEILVLFADDGIAQGVQILAKALGRSLVEIPVKDDGEGCAVEIFQFRLGGHSRCLCSCFPGRLFSRGNDLLAQISVIAALEELDQALAAAVDDAGLFEDGKKIRSLGQDLFAVGDDIGNKGIKIIHALVRQLSCLFRDAAGDCQNRAFLGLHNSLIGSLNRPAERVGHQRNCDLLLTAHNLAESAQKL